MNQIRVKIEDIETYLPTFKVGYKKFVKKNIKIWFIFFFFYLVNMKEKVVFYKYWKSILFSIIANNNIYCNEIKYKDGFAPLNVFEIGKYDDKSLILIGCDNIFVNNELIIIWDNEILRNFIIEHIDKEFIRKKINYIKDGCSIKDSLLDKDYKASVKAMKVKLKKGDKNSGHYYIIKNEMCYKNYESFEKRIYEHFNIGATDSEYEIVPDSQLDLKIIKDIKIELKDEKDIETFNILKKYWGNSNFCEHISTLKENIKNFKFNESYDFTKNCDFKKEIINSLKKFKCFEKDEVDDIIKLGYTDEEINKKIKEFEDKRDDVLNKIKEENKEKEDKCKEEDKGKEEKEDNKDKEEKPLEENIQKLVESESKKPVEENKDKKKGKGLSSNF